MPSRPLPGRLRRPRSWRNGMPSAPVRYLIVDDQRLFRGGLASLLQAFSDIALCGEAHTGEDALAQVRRHQPQVVLMDLHLPGGGGAAATAAILAEYPATTICMLTQSDDDVDLFACLRAGARGYLVKTTSVD